MAPVTADLAEAAARLRLGPVSKLTVSEAEEARTCTGCRVSYEAGIRVVRVKDGCPAHSWEEAR